MTKTIDPAIRELILQGLAIPACPLALNVERRFDERRQRGLIRYYEAAGAGGLAVGVHTTQFAIRDPKIGLFKPVLSLAADEFDRLDARRERPLVRIAGLCGDTRQAAAEAELARRLGYHAGLLSLAAMREADDDALLNHCRATADVIPVVGFYLQPAVGGRVLSHQFWRRFAEIENVVAIKIAPFDRYRTLDVIRAAAASGRDDIALYTGNDDHIMLDLLTTHRFQIGGRTVERRIVGGLLGHWAVWTRRAVELFEQCRTIAESGEPIPPEMLRLAVEVTDANAALFDAAGGFAGCIAGIHEVLRRQGLLEGIWCLDPNETLGAGQAAEINRVYRDYPHLNDDRFVAEHIDQWLAE
ncbi:MAG: dihydrodipicolinate synthase family protein [Pirellulales bacterium]|nr:dihydrodipicolinate synthase family protein [Pirellulales bacterium]